MAPRDGGLLSARGLGEAVVERFAQRQVLRPLAELGDALGGLWHELEGEARDAVVAEGEPAAAVELRRRIAFLRLVGQEATVEVEVASEEAGSASALATSFVARYRELYGYEPPERPVELASLRVVASARAEPALEEEATREGGTSGAEERSREASPLDRRRAHLGGGWSEVAIYELAAVRPGERLAGPALVLDDHATLVVGAGWRARGTAGALVLQLAS